MLYKNKGKKTECKNYRGISLLRVVGKIYVRILVDRAPRVTEGLIDDEQSDFKSRTGYIDQIFWLRQIGEKAYDEKWKVYVGFMDLEKVNDRALWQVLSMYDVDGKLLSEINSMYILIVKPV